MEENIAEIEQEETEKNERADDPVAAQTVFCLVIAAALFVMNIFFPEKVHELIDIFREHISDKSLVVPNPIDLIILNWQA